jgi:hypothetical protein
MRASDFLFEAAKVGREWQHLEDLVFVDGADPLHLILNGMAVSQFIGDVNQTVRLF